MADSRRYNAGGPLAGVVIESTIGPDGTQVSAVPAAAARDTTGVTKAPVYTPLGVGSITTLSAVKTLADTKNFAGTTIGIPAGARYAVLQPVTQAIRVADDGQTPTASLGYPIAAGLEYRYDGASLAALKIIEQTASATVWVEFYS